MSQAVKDLIDELVNDNLIEKDKIGSGNYFWCFPSKGVTAREGKVTALENTLKTMQDSVTGESAHFHVRRGAFICSLFALFVTCFTVSQS